ncbi:MAG: hypothetical protein NTX50_01560 [Candidatus Sumerlaeota bacterium]|nr:hypothetical protein [Candidatus Sumerlaeota bacterium]
MLLPLKQKRLLAACFFAMLTLALCGPALIRHDLVMGQPGSNDIIAAFAPFHAFYHRTLAAGEWPLWNPHICGGMPTAMLGQNGLFYPLNWPTFALDAYDAMDVQIALHLFLSLLLTAWIARRLGLGGAGAIAVALTWTLSGSMAGRVFAGHLTIIQAMTWFPFAWGGLYRLLAAEEGEEGARENNRAADDRNAHCISGSGQSRSDRAKDWAAAVGGFTAMGLCGAPQIWMLALITAGATAAICLIFPKIATSGSRSERLARLRALAVRFAIWGAACLLLCAAEWIPTVAAGMQSEGCRARERNCPRNTMSRSSTCHSQNC